MAKKYFRRYEVYGQVTVPVSVFVDEFEGEKLTTNEIYQRAMKNFMESPEFSSYNALGFSFSNGYKRRYNGCIESKEDF